MSTLILKNINNRGKRGVSIRPPLSLQTNKIAREEEAAKFGITLDTKFYITPNFVIHKDDKREMLWLEYAKALGVVVESEEIGDASPKAYFYIYSPEDAADKQYAEIEGKLEAQTRIRNMSPKEKADLAKLLGFSADTMTLTRLTTELYQIAETNPSKDNKRNYKTVLDLLGQDKTEYKWKLMFADLKFSSVIKMRNGVWYYNETYIGRDEYEVVTFLKDPLNSELVDHWKIELYGAPEPVVTGEVKSTNKKNANLNKF